MNKIKRIIEPLYKKFGNKCIDWFYYLPIKKNKIVFIKGNGDGYGCNLKYVAEEIIKQNLPYDLVWLVNYKSEPIPKQIRKVKFNRIKAIYELATAHVVINNTKSLIRVKKKDNQKFIYIPHGQPGCKCAEDDAILSEAYIKNSKTHSKLTDVFVSMGSYHTQVLKETFWVPDNAEIWEIGFPRNDNYYKDTNEKQKEIRRKLNIPAQCRIAMYAPTFRVTSSKNVYDLDFERILHTLEEKTQTKWIFFTALHKNFIWFKKPEYKFNENIRNMANYRDLHELLLIVDIVISDYSSVSLDFSNMRRPVFLYANDINEYNKNWGLKDMYFKLPFTLTQTNEELEKAIISFNKDEYISRLDDFYKIYGSVDDGHASERFVNKLKGIIANG